MTETAYYKDDFSATFSEQEDLLQFLKDRETRSAWQTLPTREVEFQAIDPASLTGKMLLQSYKALGKEDIINDTLKNTTLMLKADGEFYPVHSCALTTILSRARIGGNALRKVKKAGDYRVQRHRQVHPPENADGTDLCSFWKCAFYSYGQGRVL